MFIKYYVVSYRNVNQMCYEVNLYISQGWQPLGSLQVTQEGNSVILYSQAMVLHELAQVRSNEASGGNAWIDKPNKVSGRQMWDSGSTYEGGYDRDGTAVKDVRWHTGHNEQF